jgi:hypothetical protein
MVVTLNKKAIASEPHPKARCTRFDPLHFQPHKDLLIELEMERVARYEPGEAYFLGRLPLVEKIKSLSFT